MNATARCSAFTHRQRHIDLFALKASGNRLLAQFRLALGQRFGNPVLQAVNRRPLRLTLFRRHAAQCLQLFRN